MAVKEEDYKLLGLEKVMKLSVDEIKRAYKRKALQLHPDKRPPGENRTAATVEFRKLQSAYQNLLSAASRFDDLDKNFMPKKRNSEDLFKSKKRNYDDHRDAWKYGYYAYGRKNGKYGYHYRSRYSKDSASRSASSTSPSPPPSSQSPFKRCRVDADISEETKKAWKEEIKTRLGTMAFNLLHHHIDSEFTRTKTQSQYYD